MKTLVLILALVGGFTAVVLAMHDTSLAHRISAMAAEDQRARRGVDSTVAQYGQKSKDAETAWQHVHKVDSGHNEAIKLILHDIGSFPDYSIAGVKGANDFWLLVQHQDADTTLQKQVLKLMKFAVDHNQASSIHYAYLTDRVRLNTGEKQLYGTHFQLSSDSSTWQLRPVEEPDRLDERRKAVGLGPVADAIRGLNESKKYYLKPKRPATTHED